MMSNQLPEDAYSRDEQRRPIETPCLKQVGCTVWSDIQSFTQNGVRSVQCQV